MYYRVVYIHMYVNVHSVLFWYIIYIWMVYKYSSSTDVPTYIYYFWILFFGYTINTIIVLLIIKIINFN